MLQLLHRCETLTARMLRYGLILCNVLLGGTLLGTVCNGALWSYSISLQRNLLLFGEVTVACFAVVIMGALVFDYNAKRYKKDD